MEMVNKSDGQLENFKSKKRFFGSEIAQRALENKTLTHWWESYCDAHPELQNFAIRVLSLICSSFGCSYEEKKSVETKGYMNDLVYVMVNTRLTKNKAKRKKRDLTIEDFQDGDDCWCVIEEENAGGSRVNVADLDEDLMQSIGSKSTSHVNEFDVLETIESDNEKGNTDEGDGGDDDDDDGDGGDGDDDGGDGEINEDEGVDIAGDDLKYRRICDLY
ncbi:unnamed protein product [Vicia faba]|uniref:HAT C-terminal dimerisation domain-containing protein n=1 Tax=Vicia faba TaxID=3906 RepID=A0AAV0Z4J9_VICFA|nr:unnamed protein product [Vicia faba]